MTDSSNNKPVRTRFAPSPTGYVHIGNARTELFNFLFTRHYKGVHVLRVEDTDQSRLVEGAVENMLKVLKTLGIEFDEGAILNDAGHIEERGEFGPYTQSARLDIYKDYIQKLLNNKSAYYCFCTQERLDELRKEQIALKQPAMYDRHCRNLSAEEVASKQDEFKAAGKSPVVRFAIPLEGETVVTDLVFGEMKYQNAVLDDQVLIKSDGFPTYHFAVVVDDHLMEISHVIRGEEWIPSTPKHVLIYKAFGWEAPQFAHMPLILNPDKSKLSKRQGDVAVEDFLKKGYLPEALINFMAFLGWNPKTEQEIFSEQELIEHFDLEKVNKSGAVLDTVKLDWMNSEYIKAKSNAELVELAKPYWQAAGVDTEKFSSAYLEAIVELEKARLKKLADLPELTKYFFNTTGLQIDPEILVWKKSNAKDTHQNLLLLQDLFRITDDDVMNSPEKLEVIVKGFIAEHELDNGSVLWPLRYALTGEEKSPGPFEVTATIFLGLGREEVMNRLQQAISVL
ncbi:MAG TPA: glutamate--tRNA ligase [Patescibacteria group bacterium]|jgi:glutamyl-tRNA synthetase|nr:glutamate--tRNA ligase [Patescibacteria group bacterium]